MHPKTLPHTNHRFSRFFPTVRSRTHALCLPSIWHASDNTNARVDSSEMQTNWLRTHPSSHHPDSSRWTRNGTARTGVLSGQQRRECEYQVLVDGIRNVVLGCVVLRDQVGRQDDLGRDRGLIEARDGHVADAINAQRDRCSCHGDWIGNVARNEIGTVHDHLDDILHAGARHDEHLGLTLRFVDGLDSTQRDVVVAGPDRVDRLELLQPVLHKLETRVTRPIGGLISKDLDVRIGLQDIFEAGDAVGVDLAGNAFHDEDVALAVQLLDHELSGLLAECVVVASDVDVSEHSMKYATVDDHDVLAGLLDLADDGSQRGGIVGQNDEAVDALCHQVLNIRNLLLGGVGKDKLERGVGVLYLPVCDGFLGVVHDAACPAVVSGRNGDADDLGSRVGRDGRIGGHDGRCSVGRRRGDRRWDCGGLATGECENRYKQNNKQHRNLFLEHVWFSSLLSLYGRTASWFAVSDYQI